MTHLGGLGGTFLDNAMVVGGVEIYENDEVLIFNLD